MTMAIETQGKMFTDLKVTKILPGHKEFHAITFMYNGKKMVIGHSKTEGAKFFWSIEGRGTKEMSKVEFWKWIKNYEGADARKLAGYAKMMEPVSLGPVIDNCTCGRGVDYRVKTFSVKKFGVVLCKKCQGKQVAASNASGKETLHGVPVFSIEELQEMKPYQREALIKQINKALEKHGEAESLLSYREDVYKLMPEEYEATQYMVEQNGRSAAAYEAAYQEKYGCYPDEAVSVSDDQREEPAETAGVKAGSEEELYAVLDKLTIPQLKKRAELRGISLKGLRKKAGIIQALVKGGDSLFSSNASVNQPF